MMLDSMMKLSGDYTKAIELNPNDADYYYQRGNALFKMNDLEGAIRDYKIANELNPKYNH